MTTIDELVGQIPIDQVARRLGVSQDEAEQLTRQALPALVGGMEANAKDPGGASSLAKAVGQHDTGLLDGGVDLDQVDTDDGQKIVRHVFGDRSDQVVSKLSGDGKNALVAKLLPMLAPIVMAYLAKRLTGGKGGAAGKDEDGGGIGDLLGGLLGGNSGGIGDLLGGLLGGGRR
jgi:hypothetical protein